MTWVFSSTLAILATVALGSPAYAHDDVVKRCFAGKTTPKFLQEVVNENGTVSEIYDRNGDGKIDIEVVTPVQNVTFDEQGTSTYVHGAGLLFIVDQNYDGNPDAVFIDPTGKGVCSEIRLYQDPNHNRHEPARGNTGL